MIIQYNTVDQLYNIFPSSWRALDHSWINSYFSLFFDVFVSFAHIKQTFMYLLYPEKQYVDIWKSKNERAKKKR